VPTPSGLAYQWLRDGVAIDAATDATYVVTEDDVLADLSVTVTASKPDVITESKTSDAVSVPLQEFTTAPVPTISGDVTAGSTLTADPGTWVPTPSNVVYQWLRDGVEIDGADASAYVLTDDDRGTDITVKVTATRSLFADASKESDATSIPSVFDETSVPTISGNTTSGSTLTANAGAWSPTPDSFTYQWLRDGVEIDGADGSTYVLTTDDRGTDITVQVTGVLSGFWSATEESNPTYIPNVFTTQPTPTITGTAAVGSTLTAHAGTWAPAPAAFMYQWMRDGVAIGGATGATYTLTTADGPHTITVAVTALASGFTPATKVSAGVTVKGVFTSSPKPVITGSPLVGAKLTASVGSWSPKPSGYAYQWYLNGNKIKGATGKTYTVKKGDLGKRITVAVTASRTNYVSVTKTSNSVKVVKPFASTGHPTISGSAKVGSTLTAHRGLWSPNPKGYLFQWYRNGVPVVGATHDTYKLTSADKGKKVVVKVTALKPGYLPTTKASQAVTVK
jgi:hypothetical protein